MFDNKIAFLVAFSFLALNRTCADATCEWERAVVNSTLVSLTALADVVNPMTNHIRHLEHTLRVLNATSDHLSEQTKPPRCGHVAGYTYYEETGSCYRLSSNQMTWPQASATCHKEGAYLAIINSDAERLVLRAMQQKLKLGWSFIGFYREVSDVTAWRTINGETLEMAGYTTWNNGFPNQDVSHIYGGIDYDGLLISESDHAKDYIICEKNPMY